MSRTLGFHIVKTAYGLWLPGDERGSWSTAWDPQIGFIEPHTLHPGDPVRHRMAMERMQHPPVRFTSAMIEVAAAALARCAAASPWRVAAASIEPTHMHLLITYAPLNIDRTTKWLAQELTKAIHRETPHIGPVWAKGKWCSYIATPAYWQECERYIDNHNRRRGLSAKPYPFLHT